MQSKHTYGSVERGILDLVTKATRHESVAHWRSGKTIEIPDYDDIILYWHSLAIYQRTHFNGSGYQQPLRDQAEGQGAA